VPELAVIVTVPVPAPPEIEQAPDAPIVTVSPEVEVALTGNMVLYAAGDAGAANVIVWPAFWTVVFSSIDTPPPSSATARSGLPSPLKSPTATE